MKKLLFILLLASISLSVSAQSKHLPLVVKIELSDKQVIELYSKIDSLQNIIITFSTLPSNFIQSFNIRLSHTLTPINLQLNNQMVADTVKKEPLKK